MIRIVACVAADQHGTRTATAVVSDARLITRLLAGRRLLQICGEAALAEVVSPVPLREHFPSPSSEPSE